MGKDLQELVAILMLRALAQLCWKMASTIVQFSSLAPSITFLVSVRKVKNRVLAIRETSNIAANDEDA